MKRDQVLATLKEHEATLREMGVRSLAIFGSVARDEARPDSDVDLLVDLEPPYTLDRYMDVKFFLEDNLGVSVDLVMQDGLRPQIRETVEREAIYVS
ncbi:nucleotidyltransferase family protein [Leptolyngbya sp. NIES-2104]|uniref:nucleotidyltransferase family protein n=1 Tax=Leptolyngbya sp. NIES-2104 TaxID=1552121 RepID=UPI0006EC474E|nr:nucleotidyltransferase family protein [Leptolyngbya sp. NIES-2104]GAP97781.1 DNA polymerase beta-like domain [Leptolyngbya sp. NIES-2104]